MVSLFVVATIYSTTGEPVGEFAKYIAEQQKTEAFTLKQQRLYQEEVGGEEGPRAGPARRPNNKKEGE